MDLEITGDGGFCGACLIVQLMLHDPEISGIEPMGS